MRKSVFTVNIENYAPELTTMTYPLMRFYAERIGAEFRIISERRFPDFPPVYEKLQIFSLGRGNDWNIYFDSDTLVHPECIDFTDFLSKDTVMHNGIDPAMLRWRYDRFFRRDGRNIGSCNWNTWASDWCIDLWEPSPDLTCAGAIANIFPTNIERRGAVESSGAEIRDESKRDDPGEPYGSARAPVEPSHLIDDYTLSRNIAKYGLKVTTVPEVLKRIGLPDASFFWHIYAVSLEEKVKQMREMITRWKVEDLVARDLAVIR
jgi:hypothetical protein